MKIKPEIGIITELVNPNNFSFLLSSSKDYALMRTYGYNNTPLFASGEVYLSSVMDSLCCQAFYNNALIPMLNLLLLGSGGNIYKERKTYNAHSRNPHSIPVFIENSNLFHIEVPNAFVDCHF